MNENEAIKTLQELWSETNDSWYEEAYNMAIEALKQPSNATQLLDDGTLKVKVFNVLDIKRIMVMDDNVIYDSYYPDRPQGEWIDDGTELGCQCINCGKTLDEYIDNLDEDNHLAESPNYCPNCGADMRGEK